MASARARRPRLGVIVNPIAGIGGRAGLRGSDGVDTVALALALGATPIAAERARRALERLAAGAGALDVLAAPGLMGADVAAETGFAVATTGPAAPGPTSAQDTRAAAAEMLRSRVELVIFAGGDGTARDIHGATAGEVPLLGIPAGVKMHSGVFAATPDAAGAAADAYLRGGRARNLREVDIADVDEDAAREDRVATRLYGSAQSPDEPLLVLGAKAPSRSSPAALCREIANGLVPGRLYLVGPGSTTAAVLGELGLRGTLLGVDAIRDRRLVGVDLGESGLLAALAGTSDVELLIGLVGGQGALFGRGNHQLSPEVLRRIGRDHITILSSAEKLLALNPPLLRVDTGDDALDAELSGYIRVHVAPGRTIVMNVSS